MKVAIITERLLTGFGVDVVVHQQASGLIQAGYTVLVFVLKYDPILFGKTNYQIIDQKDMNLHERIAQIKAAKPEIAIAHTPCVGADAASLLGHRQNTRSASLARK